MLKDCQAVRMKKGGLKVKQWSGTPGIPPQTIPEQLDWDLYCGPSPWKPYESRRTGGTHRGYWDYEGGGMCDMGQHHYDPEQWTGKDHTSPVEMAPFSSSHPEVTACGHGSSQACGWFQIRVVRAEWVRPMIVVRADVSLDDSKEDQEKIKAMPDPEPLLSERPSNNANKPEATLKRPSRTCILHLANLAIRLGRKLHDDPDKECSSTTTRPTDFSNPP